MKISGVVLPLPCTTLRGWTLNLVQTVELVTYAVNGTVRTDDEILLSNSSTRSSYTPPASLSVDCRSVLTDNLPPARRCNLWAAYPLPSTGRRRRNEAATLQQHGRGRPRRCGWCQPEGDEKQNQPALNVSMAVGNVKISPRDHHSSVCVHAPGDHVPMFRVLLPLLAKPHWKLVS